LLQTFVAKLAAATKICLQPCQNAQQTRLQVRDDDVLLIAGVLLSGVFVSECKKKTNKHKRSTWTRRWIEQVKNTQHVTASLQSQK